MARLTRAESQAHTRRRLLDTATGLFLRDGYSSTSLERVAEEAGFSKGAVYSNFRNKDELCLEVLAGIRAEKTASADVAVARADTLEDLLTAFATWAAGTGGDQQWIRLEAEYLLNCRHDPELLECLGKRNTEITDQVTALLEANARRLGVQLPMSAREAAHALFGITLGLGLLRSLDPDIGVEPITSVIRLLAREQVDVTVPEARTASRSPEVQPARGPAEPPAAEAEPAAGNAS
ncbi:TetR/AcrR family transcriptional regulator [Amycolatopsis viridis]|uniref:AcrR family transcriptional regulator n=1 Tax=Amycolatopsis viridis TaxID=185678 RepID=A0ABX0SPX9_9PSEU|nr:TetR/AcrR family transcriptional regulator [Amycolatopsis viridis]NIH79007.1 AcrR family transcriptional regulator [Amycolatopsis viridis]